MDTKQLVISGKDARVLYPTASPEWKTALETSFGKDFFSRTITDRINTIEDVCYELGVDPKKAWNEDVDSPDEIAYKQMKLIAMAYNEGWVPDYNNTNQPKWHAWWYLNEPGFRLYVVDYDYTNSFVGSRLEFKTEALAKDAANKFKDIYEVFFTL